MKILELLNRVIPLGATRVELLQFGQKSTGFVDEFELNDDLDREELAASIEIRAEQDSTALASPTNVYSVVAKFDDPKKRSPRCIFRVKGCEVEEDGGGPTEPANAEGLTGQAMRHSEAMMRQTVALTIGVSGTQAETIARLSEQVSQMGAKHFEYVMTIEELLSEKALREIEHKREMQKMEMRATAMKEGLPLAKMLGAKVLTGGKIPAEQSPIVNALRAFVQQLDPEKFQKILSALSPIEQAGLLEILTTLTADEQTEKEKANGKAASDTDGPSAFH